MKALLSAIFMAFMVVGTAAVADTDAAGGEEIRAAIVGNTVQGSMVDASDYTEFYAKDGTIKGDGYTGSWSIDGDRMCFSYGDGEPDCYGVKLNGNQVMWLKDGEKDGTGTIVSGNPNEF